MVSVTLAINPKPSLVFC